MRTGMEQLILLGCVLLCGGFFVRELWIRFQLIQRGRRGERRWDRPLERLRYMAIKVGSQVCAIKTRPVVGLMHAFVFWGFMLFMVATINHLLGAFIRDFSLWGHNRFNNIWFVGVDWIAMLTMIGVVFLAIRRYLVKPEALTQPQPISRSWQSGVVLALIFGLMASYLLGQGVDGLVTGRFFVPHMPFSQATAGLFVNVTPSALMGWSRFFWWSHILMVFGFLLLIPHSKHLHLIAGPINIFFRSRQPIGTLEKIDFEKTEAFGVTQVTEFPWKNLVDFFSCVDCGRCQDVCPAFQSGKPLSPKVVMMSLRKHLLHERTALARGQEPSEPVMDRWLTPDEIWACTTCGACMQVCPVMNEHIPVLIELRRARVMMDSSFPSELNPAFRGLETNGNPWNLGLAQRTAWCEGLAVPRMAEKQEAEFLWFVGCAGCYDDRGKKISQALARILNTAGVDYAILGVEEKCCGDPARRSGNEYVFQMLAEENRQTMSRYRFDKVLLACPHGYHLMKNEYRQFGAELKVIHHSELIAELIANGRLHVNQTLGKTAYHDSCYLGRYNHSYEAPRQVLATLKTEGCLEMKRRRETSFCCGAGGGRMFMEESLGRRINHLRIEEAMASGAQEVATACPFCLTMLEDGVKEKGLDGQLAVMDIAEVVAEHLR